MVAPAVVWPAREHSAGAERFGQPHGVDPGREAGSSPWGAGEAQVSQHSPAGEVDPQEEGCR